MLRQGVQGKGPYLDLDTLYREIESSLRAKQRPLPQRRVRNTADRLAFRNRAFSGDSLANWDYQNAATAFADLREQLATKVLGLMQARRDQLRAR